MELVEKRIMTNILEKKLLQQIAKCTDDNASTLIEQLFTATDGLFYELSNRASTNNEENLYFEAMRAIRVSRGKIAESFRANLRANFDKIAQHATDEYPGVDTEDQHS